MAEEDQEINFHRKKLQLYNTDFLLDSGALPLTNSTPKIRGNLKTFMLHLSLIRALESYLANLTIKV